MNQMKKITVIFNFLLLTSILSLYTQCKPDDPCETVNCVNGLCVVDIDGNALCDCEAGWEGESCTVCNPCSVGNCQNGGECVTLPEVISILNGLNTVDSIQTHPDSLQVYLKVLTSNTTLLPLYQRFDPFANLDSVANNLNRLLRIYKDSLAQQASIINQSLDTLLANLQTLNTDTTVVQCSDKAFCKCPPSHTGERCADINPCFNFVCENGGGCIINSSGGAECDCLPEYSGINCQNLNPCYQFDCPPNSSCTIIDSTNTALCVCNTGYIGQECETVIADKYVGNYRVRVIDSRDETIINKNYVCTVSVQENNVLELSLENFNVEEHTVTASLIGEQLDSLQIPTQRIGETVLFSSGNFVLPTIANGSTSIFYISSIDNATNWHELEFTRD